MLPSPLLVIFASALLFMASESMAETLRVPSEYSTIQQAIVAAVEGDVVAVSPGIYFENIDYIGKEIHLLATDGPAATILDGGGNGSVVTISGGLGNGAILEGFTIRNGTGTFWSGSRYEETAGGGVFVHNSSPVVINNIVIDSEAWVGGGMVYTDGGSGIIKGNRFIGNRSDHGGGLFASGNPEISNNEFIGNEAGFFGGLLLHGKGGGVYLHRFLGIFRNNLVAENVALGSVAPSGGGVEYFHLLDVQFEFNTIVNNFTTGPGGGLTMQNMTQGGPVNCIFWGNSEPQILANLIAVELVNCAVEGGYPGASSGLVTGDPQFVTGPAGNYYLSQIAAGQAVESSCVDTGLAASVAPLGTTRTDTLLDDNLPDIGYHYPQTEQFLRGDANSDGGVDIADAMEMLSNLFQQDLPSIACKQTADLNNDDLFNIGDPIFLLSYLFIAGSDIPVSPYPDCGFANPSSALSCLQSLGCP